MLLQSRDPEETSIQHATRRTYWLLLALRRRSTRD